MEKLNIYKFWIGLGFILAFTGQVSMVMAEALTSEEKKDLVAGLVDHHEVLQWVFSSEADVVRRAEMLARVTDQLNSNPRVPCDQQSLKKNISGSEEVPPSVVLGLCKTEKLRRLCRTGQAPSFCFSKPSEGI